MPTAVAKTQKDRALRRIGPQNLVEDRLQKQNAKSIKHTDPASSSTPGNHSSVKGNP